MPNRIIRESCRTSPTLMQLSNGAERLFWRLTTVADDFGRFEAEPAIIRATCYPRATTEKSFALPVLEVYFQELRTCCLVTTYVVNGHQLAFFNTWDRHQRRRAQSAKYPPPAADNICQHVTAHVAEESRNRGIEESRLEESASLLPIAAASGAPTNGIQFQIPGVIMAALSRAPRLGADAAIRAPKFWQAEIRANPTVDYPTEILKAEAWLVAHPERHYKKLSGFLHNWLARADRE